MLVLAVAAKCDEPNILADLARMDAVGLELQQSLDWTPRVQELKSEFLRLVLRTCHLDACAIDVQMLRKLLTLIPNAESSVRWQALTAIEKLGKAACPILPELRIESERQVKAYYSTSWVATGIHFWYDLRLRVRALDEVCRQL